VSWIATASHACLVAALNADIVQEMRTVDHYLELARVVKRVHGPVCHQIAVCAATALSHATALAAEVMALGGMPPDSTGTASRALPAPRTVEEYLIDARAELAHYRSRLLFVRRLGLVRLQELFRDIIRNKRRHLAHASAIASACCEEPVRGRSAAQPRRRFAGLDWSGYRD
jgi:hypothetical protein